MQYFHERHKVKLSSKEGDSIDIALCFDEGDAQKIVYALNETFIKPSEPEQPTPAAEVIIELSKRVSALEEWRERHDKHPFERHQPRDTTSVTPIPEFDAGL